MRITRIIIQNFRSIKHLEIDLTDTTVFIGQNNSGKTAILDAVRIVLSRRWGQRGTGFTENDVHRPDDAGDPKALPPVQIQIDFEEPSVLAWDADMVAALEDVMTFTRDGRNMIRLRVSCAWSEEKEAFEPAWQFLNSEGEPLPERRRATNLTGFFSYVPLFWLGALRDAANEFTPKSGYWGRLLRSIKIPDELQVEALRILAELDARIIAADPKLNEIAEIIGNATRIAISHGPGAARVNTLPAAIEEMLQRTGIVLRNENMRPWLPLGHHGQGLQSLAVIFLFQAAVLQHLAEAEKPGVEPIFAIEEPEAHLHPQAARTLRHHLENLSGQKLITTHSPYYVQHVPLRELRLVRLENGQTTVSSIPLSIKSDLPWVDALDGFTRGALASQIFFKDPASNYLSALSWFSVRMADTLKQCYAGSGDANAIAEEVDTFRHRCRILPSREDERDLEFHGRRIRGEIFFARKWILVEGVCEYLLIHALGKALSWPMDDHGVAVIDFQLSGSAGIYPAIATALDIPWYMVVDGDPESEKFKNQILERGFSDNDLEGRFYTLPVPNNLEDQLLADGHEPLLREILVESGAARARTCPLEEFKGMLKNRKTDYMSGLSARVSSDLALAERMPAQFVNLIKRLRDGQAQ